MLPFLPLLAAGAALGWLDKSGAFDKLPRIPALGEHGSLALALALAAPGVPIVAAVAKGAAFLSAYELVKQGQISGEGEADYGV